MSSVLRAVLLAVSVVACERAAPTVVLDAGPAAPEAASAGPSASTAEPALGPVVVLAGGDVELARETGKTLLRDPLYDPFRRAQALLDRADVRFVNLESPLSEQGGETQSAWSPLVFNGPPIAADALARARIDVVSTANNHIWDYGARGMIETLHNLDRVHIAHAGASETAGGAESPAIVTVRGVKIAFLAFTAIWNQGALAKSDARTRVASGDVATMVAAVRAVRAAGEADFVLVSFHGGEEYQGAPLAGVRDALRAVVDAGADAVLGHHAHVMQAIELHAGKPILYGMGNLVMRMNSAHRWTEFGYLARIVLARGSAPSLAICPYRIDGREPVPLDDPRLVAMHGDRLMALSRPAHLALGPLEEGCRAVTERDP